MTRTINDKFVKFSIAFLLIIMVAMAPLHLGNSYLRSNNFDTVTIKTNDNLWSLAGQYTANEKDKAELVEAICEVNGISQSNVLRDGRQIKVPVITNEDTKTKPASILASICNI